MGGVVRPEVDLFTNAETFSFRSKSIHNVKRIVDSLKERTILGRREYRRRIAGD